MWNTGHVLGNARPRAGARCTSLDCSAINAGELGDGCIFGYLILFMRLLISLVLVYLRLSKAMGTPESHLHAAQLLEFMSSFDDHWNTALGPSSC